MCVCVCVCVCVCTIQICKICEMQKYTQRAVAHLHALNIVHCDVTPANVLLRRHHERDERDERERQEREQGLRTPAQAQGKKKNTILYAASLPPPFLSLPPSLFIFFFISFPSDTPSPLYPLPTLSLA
jgi:hypothetical protein